MRIESARLHPFRLRLRRPLVTSAGRLVHREGFLVALRSAAGLTGWGEATPLPSFGTESLARTRAALEALAAELPGLEASDAGDALGRIAARWRAGPAARWALDCALHDLMARERGRRVAELLAERAPCAVVGLGALLDAQEPEALGAQAADAVAEGFRTLKLKVGDPRPARDLERVAAARGAAGADVAIRLDANEAWSADEAVRRLEAFASYGPEFVEQPVPRDDLDGLAGLRRAAIVPVAADEAVATPSGLRRVLEAGAADVVVLKPAALGGLARAAALARRAREAGIDVVVTTLLDGAVSVAAALHLAAALGEGIRDCGLATSRLLANDVALPPRVAGGCMLLPPTPGLGVEPKP